MKGAENYLTITDENFTREVLQSPLLVVVDCCADWCGPEKQDLEVNLGDA